ncbi:MAG: hypothetical protein ACFFCW_12870 [Candidatus Hodarchaeota archaeon]
MSQDYLKNMYEFSYAECAKTSLIVLAKIIERFADKNLDQQIAIKDCMKWIFELFGAEIRRTAHISTKSYLEHAYERLEESQKHFERAEIDEALLMLTKAISSATTQASRALEAIEREV